MLVNKVQDFYGLLAAEKHSPVVSVKDVVELKSKEATAVWRLWQFNLRLIRVLNGDQEIVGVELSLPCLALRHRDELPGVAGLNGSMLFFAAGSQKLDGVPRSATDASMALRRGRSKVKRLGQVPSLAAYGRFRPASSSRLSGLELR